MCAFTITPIKWCTSAIRQAIQGVTYIIKRLSTVRDTTIARGSGINIMRGRGRGDSAFTTSRGRAGHSAPRGGGRRVGWHIARWWYTADGGVQQIITLCIARPPDRHTEAVIIRRTTGHLQRSSRKERTTLFGGPPVQREPQPFTTREHRASDGRFS
jgi:hypothetical protein